MSDYRKMFDENWTKAWDLDGRDVIVTITGVTQGLLKSAEKPSGSRKPVITLKGWPKPLALNKTNGAIIAGMYGVNTNDWKGKRITLYATTTSMGGKTVDCIRVRPGAPSGQGQPAPVRTDAPPEHDENAQGGEQPGSVA